MSEKLIFNKILYLDKVDSTNLYAQELLKQKKLSDPTVVMAYEQTKGRGQRSASWSSNPNENLLFSLLLMPADLAVGKMFYLSKITALSVLSFMDNMAVYNASIKWPNDIYVDGQKIAGILIENNLNSNKLASTVIGVGINVNQCVFGETLKATSMQLKTAEKYDLQSLLLEFLDCFKHYYQLLLQEDFQQIDQLYLKRLYLLNQSAIFEDSNGRFRGTITGLAEDGKLQMKKESGETLIYDIKEVRFIA